MAQQLDRDLMNKNLLTGSRLPLVLLIVCLCCCLLRADYVENRKITLPDDVFELDYSPDQQYLGAASPALLAIFQGFTGRQVQTITFDPTSLLTSFAFSRDSMWLALGFNDGSVHLFNYSPASKTFVNTTRKYQGDVQSDVTGVCFTPDNAYIAIGILSDRVAVWDLASDNWAEQNLDGQFVFTVSCSPASNVFAAGGGENTLAQLSLFEIQGDNVSISLLHNFEEAAGSTPFDTTFSDAGDLLYRVGKNLTITKYNLTTYTWVDMAVEGLTQPLQKIRVSKDGSILAVVTESTPYKIYVLNNTSEVTIRNLISANVDEDDLSAVQTLPSVIPSLALAPNGLNLFYAESANSGVLGGECDIGFFFDSVNKECEGCNQTCTICQVSADQCYECQEARYLDQNKNCLSCIVGCLRCSDGATCSQCDGDNRFVINDTDGKCVCQTGSFLNAENTCEDCIDGCLKCEDATTCVTCDQSKGFIEEGGKCVCGPGFFDDFGVCTACIRGCDTCQDETTCEICSESKHYVDGPNSTCICDEDNHFVDDGQNCVCDSGYYPDNSTCLECRIGCSECQAEDVCTECIPGLKLQDNICVCQNDGEYLDPTDKTCKKCIDVLEFCDECLSAQDCTQCTPGLNRRLSNGSCLCEDNFYPDSSKVCQPCEQLGCDKCDNPDTCLECNSTAHWVINETSEQCTCMDDYVEVGELCVDCPVGCKICQPQDLTCDTCQTHWEKDGQGKCQCIRGFFQQDSACLLCMAGCDSCKSLNVCDECDADGHFVLDDSFTCVCETGFFFKADTCLSCSAIPNCQVCESETNCTTCANPFRTLPSGQCGCDKGKYVDNTKCSECAEGCLDCSGPEKCVECDGSHSLDGGVCKKDGLDTLIIVLIVIGVLAVAGGVFALVKCVKKKRSPLSEDYEEL